METVKEGMMLYIRELREVEILKSKLDIALKLVAKDDPCLYEKLHVFMCQIDDHPEDFIPCEVSDLFFDACALMMPELPGDGPH